MNSFAINMVRNIVIISLNYFPEQTSVGLYSTQMAEFLASKKHTVTVVSSFPYYPEWRINDEYIKLPKFYSEKINGVDVFRYKAYVPKNPKFISRVRMLLDFTMGARKILKTFKNTDTIIAVVPYFTSIWLGYQLKKKTSAKLWVHIQDFEFDAVQQSGLIQSSSFIRRFLFKSLFKFERYLLNRADTVSTISQSMLRRLSNKTKTRTYFFPNWIETTKNPSIKRNHPYLTSNKVKILYAGNIGDKQDWELLLQILKKIDFDVFEIVIVGDGSKKKWLNEQLARWPKIKILPHIPASDITQLLESADIHILFQKQDVIDSVMPSKLLGMMYSGKPSLVIGHPDSEIKTIMSKAKAGIYLHQVDVHEIISAMETLSRPNSYFDPETSQRYIKEHYAKKNVLGEFSKALFST